MAELDCQSVTDKLNVSTEDNINISVIYRCSSKALAATTVQILTESGFNNSFLGLEARLQPSMSVAYDMIGAGFSPSTEPYLRSLLRAFRARKLRDLQV